jgi:hypothetical protein
MPPVSRKRSRPLGSRNKKTLAALAAAADSAGVASATTTDAASAEAAAAATAAVASIEAAPAAITAAATGDSASIVAATARKSRRSLVKQWLSYTSEHGFTTFLTPVRAGCKVRLLLPFCFVDMMGGSVLTHAIMEECSGGQPLYPVEIYHDGERKSYLCDGWPKFIADYDLKMGWSLIFTRREGSHFFCVRVVDTSNCAHATPPGRERRAPPRLLPRHRPRQWKTPGAWDGAAPFVVPALSVAIFM